MAALQGIFGGVGAFAALAGASTVVFRSKRTVPPGNEAVLMRFHAPRSYWHKDKDGEWVWDPFVIPGQVLPGMVPGMHSLATVAVSDRVTDDVVIPIQWGDDKISLTKVIMRYDVNRAGVLWAATRAPDTFGTVITSTFHHLVGNALEGLSSKDKRSKIAKKIKAAVKANHDLRERGVVCTAINLNELARTPMTQLVETIETLVGAGAVAEIPGMAKDVSRLVADMERLLRAGAAINIPAMAGAISPELADAIALHGGNGNGSSNGHVPSSNGHGSANGHAANTG